jgi:hypothetical protein
MTQIVRFFAVLGESPVSRGLEMVYLAVAQLIRAFAAAASLLKSAADDHGEKYARYDAGGEYGGLYQCVIRNTIAPCGAQSGQDTYQI